MRKSDTIMKVPPNQRGLFPTAASDWIRLLSKGENKDQIKNRLKTNEKRLTANASQICFLICSGNALKFFEIELPVWCERK